jgi:type IV pilus assembly protein PilX
MSMKQYNRQHGAALLTSVIFLLILTMLVITVVIASITEEKMAGNSRDRNLAFQAAEAALRDAMRDIHSARVAGNTGFDAACTDGLCLPKTDGTPHWIDLNSNSGWTTGAVTGPSIGYGDKTGAAALTGVAKQPRYIIEVLKAPPIAGESMSQPNPSRHFNYRATAKGYGNAVDSSSVPISQVVLQAVYSKS